MTLKLYDTMTRAKRDFVPSDPERVTMYVCGPTVYNYAHIGNFRPVVVFDLLFRVLRALYGEDHVLYAANVTDVDDKINRKAAEEGVPIGVVAERYLAAYNADARALGALAPTFQPKVTETMDAIVGMIGRLVDNGAAYAAEGHVLFSTEAFPDYGKLSGRPLEDLIAGARVDVAPYKKDPRDFVLWKPSKPGEPEWESPWGPGRPGWHIECSAMIEEALGLPIDIHGGGIDLVFPHHENELAQGVCAAHPHGHGQTYARYWLHNGFLNMAEEKMSKSVGNVALAHDLLKTWPGEALRWALLSGQYRQPLEWTDTLIEQAKSALDRLYRVLDDAARPGDAAAEPFVDPRVEAALHDDLNTPAAMAALFQISDELRSAIMRKDAAAVAEGRGRLVGSANLMGFLAQAPQAWFQSGADEDLKARVEDLLAQRQAARAAKDWPRADQIRAELAALNVEVMDGPSGATWRIKEQA
ncbi:cysteinyl-tRNA synthetase [Phenylobacterium zucineum HLK1]|uniref:Cysteine--tRNA ligase n=1 Tax=Phenylobacterium zucineum (strain HLK1) TaxID=450851 RepID=SYC_PHEZH|nr:cysteine--tRNA ligase [Phenylobacterium zucineum]B4RE90.1 RecName: Full=Cysteine--tRNA ligase; AltName: Full=Cysteinyl-tRNA synthetase; Short=CysRS [Phenylobacterium zucineum HLK1]ACG76832.1 cysteinyl-tRNA synthetase [Phenylobacterium zucineum HLK1]